MEELTRERNFVLNFELEQVFIPSSRKFQTKGAQLLKEIEPLRVFGRKGLKAIPCPRVVNPCSGRCTVACPVVPSGLFADDSDALAEQTATTNGVLLR